MEVYLTKPRVHDRADVPSCVVMHEAYADAEVLDTIHPKSNDTVAECTDDAFLENFGFLDNLEPFDKGLPFCMMIILCLL